MVESMDDPNYDLRGSRALQSLNVDMSTYPRMQRRAQSGSLAVLSKALVRIHRETVTE